MKVRYIDGPAKGEEYEHEDAPAVIEVPHVIDGMMGNLLYVLVGVSKDGILLYKYDKEKSQEAA